MHLAALNINCAQRTCRAQMLASATANATFGVAGRNLKSIWLVGVHRNHIDGADRAMFCAVTTVHTIGFDNAILFYPNGVTN